MKSSRSPLILACFALGLAALGFIAGYGYGFGVRSNIVGPNTPRPTPSLTPNGTPNGTPGATPAPTGPPPPEVKGLRAAPNDGFVAFTGVYDGSRLAARFILNLKSGQVNEAQTPPGWQDYITQWSRDSKSLLFERERIPRPVAAATAGLYSENIGANGARTEPELLTDDANVPDERITAGFWTPDGKLAVKTRREPKSLFVMENGVPRLIDRAGMNFQQHRAVQENGRTVFYTVRDVPSDSGIAMLFRVENGKATPLSDNLPGAVWVYLEDNARHMVVCHRNANSVDWDWTLYAVSPRGAKQVKTARVPGDVISVYWSPDGRHILGAGGKSLWIVDIPSLQARRITNRTDWNAADACWLWREKSIIVAAAGVLSKVAIADGATRELWRFPDSYWR